MKTSGELLNYRFQNVKFKFKILDFNFSKTSLDCPDIYLDIRDIRHCMEVSY